MVKRKKNILIVEDNEFYMNLISNALEKVPCINIYKAANSAEAYKCAMETTVDVFVVDVILDTSVSGDVSGIKYVERIRTIDKYKFTPIIITSSLEDPKLHSYNYLHCYRYFEKTYDIRELLNTILETLEYKTPEEENKINLFLIEEPENHLHRSMQIALSHILFFDNKYQYLFMTTHSPYVLAEMDQVNLVRIYNEDKIVSRSVLYTVPAEFKSQRKMLNRGLIEAVFADKVLLVEGPSENVLFGKVLSEINPFYEADGIYILQVGGFGFKPYYEILDALQIDNIIKTDNDLRKIKGKEEYSALGFSRLNNYIGEKILPDTPIAESGVEAKRRLYDDNKKRLDEIRKEYSIYLSRCSLEEDLDEVIHDQMITYLQNADGDPIGYLKDAKNNHMVELVEKLTTKDCKCIYEHYNFACLKEVMS